jgi:hypothetical protein
MKNVQTTVLAVFAIIFIFANQAKSTEEMKGSDLRELLSGSTIVGVKFNNLIYEKSYNIDGTWKRVSRNGHSNVGTWRIDELERYCKQRNGLKKETCTVVKNEDGIFTNYKQKTNIKGKSQDWEKVAIWSVKSQITDEESTALLMHKALNTIPAAGK